MNKKTIVINLLGGPGSGKSTLAAGLFRELKMKGVTCELLTEYAKDRVWEENYMALNDQLYIFAKQNHRQFKLREKVDVIITDAPLILSLYYGKDLSQSFKEIVHEKFNEYENYNYFLNRKHPYEKIGRTQNEEQADQVASDLKDALIDNGVSFKSFDTNDDLLNNILKDIYFNLKIK